ncbi:hypothetical protein [Phaeobacter inhibens]|uniref:Uncharacterized protein n=1 Tax=Phaeobacter inhibens TaxID=221822 RepID=A0A135IMI6_9RHOB|nr:hypothetical protein [Phaeobacter inhibens]AUQ71034.1 hypothetical protein PhaeoP54_02155 [Phaeobacter inhibens]AUQ98102.1 hypothetical protein PhaeoP88_00706 [Phaeobacter inhibens]KXF91531.1 hypothetical protein AT574_06305 [Phaeobacter inhibens]WHP68861.1 hypothetical protein QMZ01_01345 [Phaeobacter inhibens]
MTAENVVPGDLCTVHWSEDGVVWEEIPKCKTVGVPEENPEYRDRTSLSSPGRSREWGVGLTDTSELTLNCFYSTALIKKARQYKAARKAVFFKVELPPEEGVQSTGDVFDYKAFVNPSTPNVDHEGDLMTDLKLRPTGIVGWTEGAAL